MTGTAQGSTSDRGPSGLAGLARFAGLGPSAGGTLFDDAALLLDGITGRTVVFGPGLVMDASRCARGALYSQAGVSKGVGRGRVRCAALKQLRGSHAPRGCLPGLSTTSLCCARRGLQLCVAQCGSFRVKRVCEAMRCEGRTSVVPHTQVTQDPSEGAVASPRDVPAAWRHAHWLECAVATPQGAGCCGRFFPERGPSILGLAYRRPNTVSIRASQALGQHCRQRRRHY